jgi:type II secretory pathway component PulM
VSYLSDSARFFGRLKSRDKRALIMGAILVAAFALLILFESLWDKHISMHGEILARKTDLEWIGKQVPIIKSLQTSCNQLIHSGSSDRELLTTLIRRNQLKLGQLDLVDDGIALTLSSGDTNDILRLVEQLACEGFILTQLDIERVLKPAEGLDYRADLNITRELGE